MPGLKISALVRQVVVVSLVPLATLLYRWTLVRVSVTRVLLLTLLYSSMPMLSCIRKFISVLRFRLLAEIILVLATWFLLVAQSPNRVERLKRRNIRLPLQGTVTPTSKIFLRA